MADWISFWNGDHPIYVSERHRSVHFARITSDILRHFPSEDARVLDYGCGEALGAEAMAPHCARLVLSDSATTVRARLAERVAPLANVEVKSPEEVAALPAASFDLIVVNSLLQYLSLDVLDGLLATWRRLLAPGGRLLIADVIPPDSGALDDAGALLAFGLKEGFFIPAVIGLARTAVSPYRKLRAELGLTTHAEADLLARLKSAGFEAERVKPNIGHNQKRMAFIARPA